jgi:hypothetical protein
MVNNSVSEFIVSVLVLDFRHSVYFKMPLYASAFEKCVRVEFFFTFRVSAVLGITLYQFDVDSTERSGSAQ